MADNRLPIDEAARLFERVWLSEDNHGHRYMAQLTDGPNGVRWLLPLSRNEFEQLYAAVMERHPELAERFGSPVNMIRQYVGQLMYYLLEMAHDDELLKLPVNVEMAHLNAKIQARREMRAAHLEALDAMRSRSLTIEERELAYGLLERLSDEELDALFEVRPGTKGRDVLREVWSHG
jgi:hypothetical protein